MPSTIGQTKRSRQEEEEQALVVGFADASGVLDWYHASEHVWACGKVLHPDNVATWADEALELLRYEGGTGLIAWLEAQRSGFRRKKRAALNALLKSFQPRLDLADYPTYRAAGWQIGTGMIESTAKQLVGVRLKGPAYTGVRGVRTVPPPSRPSALKTSTNAGTLSGET